jgi:hypothetical protein
MSPIKVTSEAATMGAFLSVFMEMTYLDFDIPARCCRDPEMPQAIYKSGLTVFPVWPI